MTRHRRLFDVLAVLSALLCAALICLWCSSFFIKGHVPLFRGQKRAVYAGSGNGVLVFRHNRITSPPQATFRHNLLHHVDRAIEPFTLAVQAGVRGQVAIEIVGPAPIRFCWVIRAPSTSIARMTLFDANRRSMTITGQMDQLDISYWLPVALLSIAPLWWYCRRLREKRGAGLCRTCGYDLRATPERCPECGSVPTASG